MVGATFRQLSLQSNFDPVVTLSENKSVRQLLGLQQNVGDNNIKETRNDIYQEGAFLYYPF